MNQKGILDHDTFLGLIQSLNSFADNFKNSKAFLEQHYLFHTSTRVIIIRPCLQKER